MGNISRASILVVSKDSKLDYDCRRLQVTRKEMLRQYEAQGAKVDTILASHQQQREGKRRLAEMLCHRDQIVPQAEFQVDHVEGRALVVSFGGDNHFQFVSRYLCNQLILGLNSDPARSDGCLTQVTIDQLPATLECLKAGRYEVQEWTRFAVELNGQTLPFPATCEAAFGELHMYDMSRHILEVNGNAYTQKGSGLLVFTGAGSSGWAQAAGGQPIERTDRSLGIVLREAYSGRITHAACTRSIVPTSAKVYVRSLNDANGVVVLDALDVFDFPLGAKAQIKESAPLRVVVPQL